jgi:hypothetical protein
MGRSRDSGRAQGRTAPAAGGGEATAVRPEELGLEGPVTYPEAPADLAKFSWRTALKYFGPGAIIAGATIGSGETVFAARGGAVFGYAILWTFVLGALFKAAMQYSVNRYTVVAGEHPMLRWVTLIPGPRGLVHPLSGDHLDRLVSPVGWRSVGGHGRPRRVPVGWRRTGVGHGSANRPRHAGMARRLLGHGEGLSGADTRNAWSRRPRSAVRTADWLDALLGLIPNVPSYEPWFQERYAEIAARPVWVELVTYVGAIGGGTYDYIGYAGMLRQKRWGLLGREDLIEIENRFAKVERGAPLPIDDSPEEVRKAKAWARAPFGDVTIANVVMILFALGFIIQGANLLHEASVAPSEDTVLVHQARFLTVIAPWLKYLWYAAAFAALGDTVYALWEIYTHTAYESIGAFSERVRSAGIGAIRPWVYLYVGLTGLIAIWIGGDLVTIVTWAAILGGSLTIGAMALAMPWTEKRMLPPGLRMRKGGSLLVTVSGVALLTLGIVAILQGIGVIPSV